MDRPHTKSGAPGNADRSTCSATEAPTAGTSPIKAQPLQTPSAVVHRARPQLDAVNCLKGYQSYIGVNGNTFLLPISKNG